MALCVSFYRGIGHFDYEGFLIMEKKTCVFCKKKPPEIYLTREHVLPDWMDKKLKSEKKHGYICQVKGKELSKRNVSGTSILSVTVNRVCNKCNNGWMSQELEGPLVDYLERMATNKAVTLNSQIQEKLALWAFKTALIRSLIDKDATIPEYFDIVYQKKIPKNTYIWVVNCGEKNSSYVTRHIWAKDDNGKCCAFSSTIVVLGFAVQILSYLDEKPTNYNLDYFMNEYPNASRIIWPDQQTPDLNWPLYQSIPFDPELLPDYVIGQSPLINLRMHLTKSTNYLT